MPTILETIRQYEEDILIMIAEAWGIDLDLEIKKNMAEQIASQINQDAILQEMIHSLSKESIQALKALSSEKEGIPWDQFIRKYGDLREIGAGRRERERPDRTPVSATEALFYKALIGRAFFETNQGFREFAYIPEEFYQILNPVKQKSLRCGIEPAPSQQVEKILLTNDNIIDNATTVLAGLRISMSGNELALFTPAISYSFLIALLKENKLVTDQLKPSSEKVKLFLGADRGNALGQFARSWADSQEIDDLDLLESLEFEGHRKGKSQISKSRLLQLIQILPENTWFGIQQFCNLVYKDHPDILRSGGEYDAWFIKNRTSGDNINGFKNWQNVEGEYIRTMILKPLFWLGFVDLGKTRGDSVPTVFRKSKWFTLLRAGHALKYPSIQKKDFEIEKSGRIIIERSFPRDIRYQLARCCEWESVRGQKFFYHLSPHSFFRMDQQGLKVSQLVMLINRCARKPVPQNILLALERWEKHGLEANLENIQVVKVKLASHLDQLMASPAKKFIITRLNSTTAEITAGSAPYIKAALIDMGIFAEIKPEV